VAALGFAGVAQGAIAGGGQQFSTNRPDVVSATINNTLVQSYVDVCFDTSVQLAPGFSNGDINLTGVNVLQDLESPISVTTTPGNTSCIRLLFAPAVNLGSYTVVEIAADVVVPAGGAALGNVESAARLDNTDVAPVIGRIGGPNLVSTIPVDVGGPPGTGAVQYTFDKVIAPVADPTKFGYYAADGEFETGDTVFTTDGYSVIIVFTGLAGDDPTPSSAANFFVLSEAVNLDDRTDPDNSNRAESIGTRVTGRPELLSVTPVGVQQGSYDLQYDQIIQPNDLSDCRAVLSVGPTYGADAAQVIGNGTILRVTFNELIAGNFGAELNSDDEVVRVSDEGAADGGCVQDINTARASVTKSIALRLGDNVPGFTSGPDLTGCVPNTGTNEVQFVFDELLSTQFPFVPDPADFEIKSTLGSSNDGLILRDVTNNVATVIFPGGTDVNAAACHVDRAAVYDRDPRVGFFDPNPSGTVKWNSVGTLLPGQLPVGDGTVFVAVPGPPGTITNTITTIPSPPVVSAFQRQKPQALSMTVHCTPKGRGRYTCVVTGRLTQANTVRALGRSKACTGTVKVQYKSGKKTISTRLAKIKSGDCTYRSKVFFSRPDRIASGLKVRGRYNGNKYALTKYSRTLIIKR
jgi:hypothetical protein